MKYFKIGEVINTHGLKGELKIYSTSDFDDERYQIGNTVYLYQNGHDIFILQQFVANPWPLLTNSKSFCGQC